MGDVMPGSGRNPQKQKLCSSFFHRAECHTGPSVRGRGATRGQSLVLEDFPERVVDSMAPQPDCTTRKRAGGGARSQNPMI